MSRNLAGYSLSDEYMMALFFAIDDWLCLANMVEILVCCKTTGAFLAPPRLPRPLAGLAGDARVAAPPPRLPRPRFGLPKSSSGSSSSSTLQKKVELND
jgi:hypothetical protein